MRNTLLILFSSLLLSFCDENLRNVNSSNTETQATSSKPANYSESTASEPDMQIEAARVVDTLFSNVNGLTLTTYIYSYINDQSSGMIRKFTTVDNNGKILCSSLEDDFMMEGNYVEEYYNFSMIPFYQIKADQDRFKLTVGVTFKNEGRDLLISFLREVISDRSALKKGWIEIASIEIESNGKPRISSNSFKECTIQPSSIPETKQDIITTLNNPEYTFSLDASEKFKDYFICSVLEAGRSNDNDLLFNTTLEYPTEEGPFVTYFASQYLYRLVQSINKFSI